MVTENLPALREQPELTPFEVIERVITSGDLSRMEPAARIAFYWRTCESLGLNPLTKPFEYINLNGKLTLYAKKDATEQLRRKHHVSITALRRETNTELGTYTVYAHGRTREGDEDEASGVVTVKGLGGETLANALMKAETKAKRRLTLSLVGLGFLDESEIEGAEPVEVDPDTGEIRQAERPSTLLEQVQRQRERLRPTDAPGSSGRAAPSIDTAETSDVAATPETGGEAAQDAETSDEIEGQAIELDARCQWRLEQGRGKPTLACGQEPEHKGDHDWAAIAVTTGGRVLPPERNGGQ